jgi:Domain of unknown function (DUF4326)
MKVGKSQPTQTKEVVMIRIENKKTYQGEGIYIGRPSLLGNPFRIGEDGTREEIIERYRGWLWRQINLRGEAYRELKRIAELAKHGDVTLICWCKRPDRQVACHGDVLRRAVEWLNRQESSVVAPHAAITPELPQPPEAKSEVRPRIQECWLALLCHPV